MDEPDYQQSYREWSAAPPTPQSTGKLLAQLEPVISKGVNNYGGGKNDPLMVSRARRLTLNALKTYDPKQGTRLSTHVSNNLQGLRRVARQQSQILRVPDRVSMEQAYLHSAQMELTDSLGREPATEELADYSGFSPRKISRIRRYVPAAAEGSISEGSGDIQFAGQRPDEDRINRMALAIHGDLVPRDQQILEWSLGLYGNSRLDNNQIAARLGVTPGAVSQRKDKIQQKLDYLLQGL